MLRRLAAHPPLHLLAAGRCAATAGSSSRPVKVHIRGTGGTIEERSYPAGINLMGAIRDDGTCSADMHGSCSAQCECSTCHIYVEGEWAAKVEKLFPMSEKESDAIDSALDPKDNSRLACQIVLSADLDGLTIAMPSAARDARFEQFVSRSLAGKK